MKEYTNEQKISDPEGFRKERSCHKYTAHVPHIQCTRASRHSFNTKLYVTHGAYTRTCIQIDIRAQCSTCSMGCKLRLVSYQLFYSIVDCGRRYNTPSVYWISPLINSESMVIMDFYVALLLSVTAFCSFKNTRASHTVKYTGMNGHVLPSANITCYFLTRTLDGVNKRPYWRLDGEIIGSNPGKIPLALMTQTSTNLKRFTIGSAEFTHLPGSNDLYMYSSLIIEDFDFEVDRKLILSCQRKDVSTELLQLPGERILFEEFPPGE